MHWYLFVTILTRILCNEDAMWMQYGGERFPLKYLSPEESIVTSVDMDYYIKRQFLPLTYFNEAPNETDVSIALCAFYTKSLLKRTIKDYGTKLRKNQTDSLKTIIHMSENIVSHYIYYNRQYDWGDIEFRVSKLFKSDESQVYSIGDFNRNQLTRWIITQDNNVNKYLEGMDRITMPKQTYAFLSDDNPEEIYYIGMYASDQCISRIPYNSMSINVTQLRKCKTDAYCEKQIYSNSSIAYYLSHRFLNIYFRMSRRCYIRSEMEDRQLMDRICANMYREAVYLARRGYFARDLFLEHVALCGMLGYMEFHRKNWFYKAASWINRYGCVVEDKNFVKNRSKLLKTMTGVRQRRPYITYFCKQLMSECDEHPTALIMVVLAHGIRHASRFMTNMVFT